MVSKDKSTTSLALNRREWLGYAAAFGVGLSALPSFAQTASTPRKGGILTIVNTSEPPNFDIFSNTSSSVLSVVAPCYNSLLVMDPTDPDKIVGDLATSWDVSADGKSYTFQLVRNAHFHDGKPLTSADVKATFDIARNPPANVVSARKQLLAAIESVETPDPYTVRFVLSRPSPALLTTIASAWFLVAPKHVLDAKGDTKADVIGSGPYMFKEIKRGVSVELVRNPNYHVAGRPHLDGIRMYTIPDAGSRIAYMRSGEVMMYIDMPPTDAMRVQREFGDRVLVHSAPNYTADPFIINTRRKPYDDVRVRRALSLAIDRQDALKVIYGGAGVVGGFMPPGPWGLPAEDLAKIPGYSGDMESRRAEARRLLAEAGLPNGFSTVLTGRKGAGTHDDRVVYLAEQFGRIGIKATVNLVETAAYFQLMNQRNFDIATSIISSYANDPDLMFADYHTCEGTQNFGSECVQQIDDLYAQQSKEVDAVQRRKLVRDMELKALNEFGTIVLYFKNKFVASSRRVQGFQMHPEPDNNRRMQDVWLAS